MKTDTSSRIALACALTLGLAASLTAQTAPPPPNNPPSEVITLSPFTVDTTTDRGYVAIDSLAGGRQNTPLRVTPSAVSAMTSEFLSDLGVTDLQDALQWSLNVIPTNFRSGNAGGTAGDTHNFWSVSIRGDAHVQGGNPPTKNYFPTFMVIDTYNVERIEVNSGPNSILYGIGDIGGSLTTYTKVPRFDRDFQNLTLRATSFGAYRGMVDVNQTVGNVALRVNGVWANEKGWRDGDYDKRKGVDVAASYRFNENTEVRLSVEGWKQKRNVYAGTVTDGMSLWNGTTDSPTWGAAVSGVNDNPVTTPGAPGVRRMEAWGGANDYRVWINGIGLMNWAGGLRSAGVNDYYSNIVLREDTWVDGQSGRTIPALPDREFAIAPPDSTLEPESISATLSFDHRINENSEFQVQGYRYVDTAKAINFEGAGGGLPFGVAVDLNRQLPNGQANPNFGKRYSDFFLDKQTQNHRVGEVRGQYTYRFDTTLFNIPLKQSFSISGGYQVTDYDARQYQAIHNPVYDAPNWTRSMVWGRVYWDNPQGRLDIPNDADIAYRAHTFNWYDFDSTQKITYGGLFSQSRFWDDRLNITLGARRDSYENEKQGLRGPDNPVVISKDDGNTYTVGVVGYVLPWLGIVGNVSSNFQPAAGGLAASLYGEPFGPSFGKGRDVGLRVSTKDHRYYASLNYYKTKSTDVIGAETPGFQAIWTEYVKAGGTARDIGPAGTISGQAAQMSFNDTYDVEYEGVEFELVANPTDNIRMQVRYSRPEGERTNSAPNSRRYFAEHLADWQAVAPSSTPLTNLLNDGQRLLDNTAVPAVTANLPTSIFNTFVTYSFRDGPLDGFEVGAGATALGEQYGPPSATVNGERTKAPSYTTYSMMLGYSMRLDAFERRVNARFQLNVDNLLDEDKLIFTSYQVYGGNQIQGANYRYLNPRRFTLTATFEF